MKKIKELFEKRKKLFVTLCIAAVCVIGICIYMFIPDSIAVESVSKGMLELALQRLAPYPLMML